VGLLTAAMETPPVFADVSDTPMFRQRAAELQHSVETLKEGCGKLAKEAVKYCEELEGSAKVNEGFSRALVAFCSAGNEDQGELIGQNEFSKFSLVFSELADLTRALQGEMVDVLVEPLRNEWVGQLCTDVCEEKKHLDKKTTAYDLAKTKYLGLRRVTKKDVVKRTEEELSRAKGEADEARYCVARKLTEVELRKSHEFLGMMANCMESQLQFFEKGYTLLKEMEPLIWTSKEMVSNRQKKMTASTELLERRIAAHQEQERNRAEVVADSVEMSEPSTAGPLQMSADMMEMVTEVEMFVRASLGSQGKQITAIKQGYLSKRSSNMRGDWKRRFFVLDSMGILYYYTSKSTLLSLTKRETTKKGACLVTSSVKPYEEEDLRFCFSVVSPERSLHLQAESELEKQEWIVAIQVGQSMSRLIGL